MSELTLIESCEIEKTHSGHWVPIINGIHLHSRYDPEKEAIDILKKDLKTIRENSKILVLGLGFGFHVKEIARELKNYHHASEIKIVVIEPNYEVMKNCRKYYPWDEGEVEVICEQKVDVLYQDHFLVNFLTDRPGVIFHAPSFNLNIAFFRKYLTYQAEDNVRSMIALSRSYAIKGYLENKFEMNDSFNELIKNLTGQEKISHEEDFLMLAVNQLK